MFYMVRLCKGYVYICKKCVTMRSTMQEVMQYMKIMFASLLLPKRKMRRNANTVTLKDCARNRGVQ